MNRVLLIALCTMLMQGKLYSQSVMPNTISPIDKVYGLSKFWQEVNRNFVYLNNVDIDRWNDDYKRLIGEVQSSKNDYDYYRLLMRFCAQLKDGHTNVYYPKAVSDCLNYSFGEYRFFVGNIEGQAIITRVNRSKKGEIPIGSQIVEVNGMPVKEYVNEYVLPYVSSSTDYVRLNQAYSDMFYAPDGTAFKVKIERPDSKEVIELNLICGPTAESEVYPPFEERGLIDYRKIKGNIAYVALNSFAQPEIVEQFVEILPKIREANGLIIDLRFNGGGNSSIGIQILKHLTPDSLIYQSRSRTKKYIAAYRAWRPFIEPRDTIGMAQSDRDLCRDLFAMQRDGSMYHNFPYSPIENDIPNNNRVTLPIVLLMGNNTASAAEDFLVAADGQKHITKIGEHSYGSTGQPLMLDLPGGGSARVCTINDTYRDGREFVGVGVIPDIFVMRSIDDLRQNRDAALECAVDYLRR